MKERLERIKTRGNYIYLDDGYTEHEFVQDVKWLNASKRDIE